MDKPQIIGLGLNGLVGSRITQVLSNKFEFIELSRSTGVDIGDPASLTKIKDSNRANYILHLSAKTDVDGCEKDKELGEAGEAWRINVAGSANVAEIARELGKKVIYISTDFVFDGQKPKGESYKETDVPNPINWYAFTKFEGEKVIEKSGCDFAILRIAYPYRAKFDLKKDFFRSILDRLQNGQEIKTVEDHIFCPTFIDDIAIAIEAVIANDATGIYHAVGSQSLSPYEATLKIANVFKLDPGLVTKTTREEFFKDRAPRPFNLSLRNDKIRELGVRMRGFEEGLLEIRKQMTIDDGQ